MIRSSSSSEPAKPKRKSTRSVSTLTPARLARKRANDREAQRAIRARTKAHIEELERKLAELKSKQGCDKTVQELLRRNKAIEKELIRLNQIIRAPMTSSSYSAPNLTPRQFSLPDELLTSTVCEGHLGTSSYAIPSPHRSPSPGDYNCLHHHSQQYIPLSSNCEPLACTISCTIPCSISAPSSADYSAGFTPTSVPTSVLPSNDTTSSSIRAFYDKDVVKMEYDEVGHHGTIPQQLCIPGMRYDEEVSQTQFLDAGFRLSNPPLHPDTLYSHPDVLHHQ